jgi:Rrf2 family protein
MLSVARHGTEDNPASLEQVAKNTDKSKRYLEQIALSLKRASLLRAVSGRRGGYYLARPSDQITLGDIVEATIGPVSIVDCVLDAEECEKADSCEFRLMYMVMNLCFTQTLQQYTLADMDDAALLESLSGDLRKKIEAQEQTRRDRIGKGQVSGPIKLKQRQPVPPKCLHRGS